MATTSTAKKKPTSSATSSKKPSIKVSTTPRKTPAKRRTVAKRQPAKSVSQKVDYYPNRMTLAISVLAGTLIVLLALIAVLGQR